MDYGTAYGREPIVWKLGREALALTECDKLDGKEGDDVETVSWSSSNPTGEVA